MIAQFFMAALAGYSAPRRSARAALDTGSPGSAFLMVVLAYLIGQILLILTPGTEILRVNAGASYHLIGVMQSFAKLFILSAVGFLIGRMAGGTGNWPEVQVVVAWHMLVTSFLAPPVYVLLAGMLKELQRKNPADAMAHVDPGLALPLSLAAGILWLWLLAQYLAEAHRIRNAMGLLGILTVGGLVVTLFMVNGLVKTG